MDQALLTLRSKETVKVIAMRGINFPPVAAAGASAKIENAPSSNCANSSQELTKSVRPELTSVKVVVSGVRIYSEQGTRK